ncbi:hypothetical protein OHA72_46695 [Dactylosporangium sp. NBC_01737]|uniref:hypothetical protein n=1 Tax=Dactylosporangium sp. NBC_01737 TaxID=2975959 RepID=UPI002E136225|nr:hypothetical protein OHA72_46695 [Dactylosporangium sp. NBC_01737]
MEQEPRTRLRNALALVQRDLEASGVRRQLHIEDVDGSYVVALDDGSYWGGGPDVDGEGDAAALWTVAEAAQDLLAVVLGTLWPICPGHDLGLHVWPDWAGPDRSAGAGFGTPTWWCNADGGHRIANVGQLPPVRT